MTEDEKVLDIWAEETKNVVISHPHIIMEYWVERLLDHMIELTDENFYTYARAFLKEILKDKII